jgi:hypothetical protein
MPIVLAALAAAAPTSARAYVGFAVGGAGAAPPAWEASHVVVMREGSRSMVTLQARVTSAGADAALVVAVPGDSQDARMVPREPLAHLERFTAPRLVESREADPCEKGAWHMPWHKGGGGSDGGGGDVTAPAAAPAGPVVDEPITILADEAAFAGWAAAHSLPAGADAAARGALEAGMKLLVVRVAADADGRTTPLQFHHEAAAFTLPTRLGELPGPRDLLIHVLAAGTRYEASGLANVAAPTNLEVHESAASDLAGAYAGALAQVWARHPGAVVTEFAGALGSCRPCTVEAPGKRVLLQLGAEALERLVDPTDVVATRMHVRGPTAPLELRAGVGIVGGISSESSERGGAAASAATWNDFKVRWAVRRPWTGPVGCAEPVRRFFDAPTALAAADAPFAPPRPLAGLVTAGFTEGTAVPAPDAVPGSGPPGGPELPLRGCGRCDAPGAAGDLAGLWLAAAALLLRRRARQRGRGSLA